MLRGSCLCGGVRYEISGSLGRIVYCHCSQCRKASGTAFATNTPVDSTAFRVVEGADKVRRYESSEGKWRCFCSVCGSPIYSETRSRPNVVRVRIGTLDSPAGARPIAHFFASSKAEWFEILDGLPTFDESLPAK